MRNLVNHINRHVCPPKAERMKIYVIFVLNSKVVPVPLNGPMRVKGPYS